MSEAEAPFGRSVLVTADPVQFLALERSAGLAERFAQLDGLITSALQRMLRGERLVEVTRDRTDAVALVGLDQAQPAFMDEAFSLEWQQARGAWFLPETASVRAGLLNLPFFFREYPRFATGLALEERAKIRLQDSPDAVLTWALLEPLVEQLFQPFELRGPEAGLKDRDEHLAAWATVDQFFGALGFDVSAALLVMRYGGGWSRLRPVEQVAAKQRLLGALAREMTGSTAGRYRAASLRSLIQQYYDKAKRRAPTRRQALSNRTLQRVLSGYFGGDWLAFLVYIGEEPHPDERIATALPEPRLQVSGAVRAGEVAAELGLPAAEVERMLAAYWDRPTAASPIEERVEALGRYWQAFENIHSRQASGMQPLWGLVADTGFFSLDDGSTDTIPYQEGLYRTLLSPDLLADIERLWGTAMLPRWPERMVTQQSSHLALAETFGPALKFWHGCALTAWFICEGPYSRTDLAGMAHYYRHEIAQLAAFDCPIDGSLFTDLLNNEKHLGPAEPIPAGSSTTEVRPGVSITLQVNHGSRRRGFELLRDIVTRHRRAWTAAHLERYLRARWEAELHAVGHEYNRLIEDKGKPPTPKQFASRAATATNAWFGGDMSALYGALGEKVSLRLERTTLMPADRIAFAWAVFSKLGGTPFRRQTVVSSVEEGDAQNERRRVYENLTRLAEQSLWYVQLKEALGRSPELKEFGRGKFEWLAPTLAEDIDEAWERYRRAVESSLSRRPPSKVSVAPTAVRTQQSVILTSAGEPKAVAPVDGPLHRVPEREPARSWWKRLLGH